MSLNRAAPLLLALLLVAAAAAQQQKDKDDTVLARAYFRWSAEGWNATTKKGESWPSSGEMGQLKASDDDDTIWYFSASADFLGNKAEAYGGTISFTLGHSEYNSLGLGAQEEHDIILENAALNLSIGHKSIIPPWVTSSDNVVEISEDGGWVDTQTGESASRLKVLRTLSHLTALKIRGSLYYGHEFSYIKDVTLQKGQPQDIAWVRNDPHIDELCGSLKLNAVACEHYGVHLMKAMQKVNMNKMRAEHQNMVRKRKEHEEAQQQRRKRWEQESMEEAKKLAANQKTEM